MAAPAPPRPFVLVLFFALLFVLNARGGDIVAVPCCALPCTSVYTIHVITRTTDFLIVFSYILYMSGASTTNVRTNDPPTRPSSSYMPVVGRHARQKLEDLYLESRSLQQRPITEESFEHFKRIKLEVQAILLELGAPPPLPSSSSSSSSSRRRRKGALPSPSLSASYIPYPDITDDTFNHVIPTKKEFALGAYPPIEIGVSADELWRRRCSSTGFRLSHNQQFLRNLVSPSTPYNGILLFHGVGTGKTCAAVTIAEQFTDKKVLVLVQPGLQRNFDHHIFDFDKLRMTEGGMLDVEHAADQCTGTRYLTDIPDAELFDKARVARRISKMVTSRYSFKWMEMFAKEVNRLVDSAPADWPQRIRAKYSNHVLIVDEAHHLRVTKDEDNKKVTRAIRKVLQYAEGIKLVMLTATPMYNNTSDLVELLNLLHINDKRPPLRPNFMATVFDPHDNITDQGERAVRDATRGYVSYLRGDDPFSFPLRLTPAHSNDPQALTPHHPRHPNIDSRGGPIAASDAFQSTVLLQSEMGPTQNAAYKALARNIYQHVADEANALDADDEVGDDDGTPGPLVKRYHPMLSQGMALSNVVFPVDAGLVRRLNLNQNHSESDGQSSTVATATTADALRVFYGTQGFNNCFTRVSSREGLRFRYADGVPHFLGPDMLHQHAPKMKSIVDRVLSSEGTVFVYSQFLWSGLIPLAMALEHVGFTRYGQDNLLSTDQLLESRSGPHARRAVAGAGMKYVALTASKQEFSTQFEQEVAAAKAAGPDGTGVKVILASQKAAEGLDFRNIRAVHILDPWYNFNRIEQVIGRAARNCSHIDLPLEKRNVTVFLHVALMRGADRVRETIDTRAYRIAEHKQSRISKLESILVSNSVDCNLNRHVNYFDPKRLGMHTQVITSQGVLIRDFLLGDRFPRRPVTCDAPAPAPAPGPHTDSGSSSSSSTAVVLDSSTYRPLDHVGDVHLCKTIFMKMFETGVAHTAEEVARHCRDRVPGVSDEAVMIAIQQVLDERVPVRDGKGNDGYVMYASDKYMFQRSDAFDERESVSDRTAHTHRSAPDTSIVFRAKRVDRPSTARRASSSLPHSNSRTRSANANAKDPDADNDDTATRILFERIKRTRQVLASMYRVSPDDTNMTSVVTDFEVDRLDHAALMSVVRDVLTNRSKTVEYSWVKDSLIQGAVLIFQKENASSLRHPLGMYDYYRGVHMCFPKKWSGDDKPQPCAGIQLRNILEADRGERQAAETDPRRLKGYLSPPVLGRDVRQSSFKIMGSSQGSSGCVCKQTSNIKIKDMMSLMKDAYPQAGANMVFGSNTSVPLQTVGGKKLDKQQLCMLYELLLRRFRPQDIIRPAIAARVFSQKSKRLK